MTDTANGPAADPVRHKLYATMRMDFNGAVIEKGAVIAEVSTHENSDLAHALGVIRAGNVSTTPLPADDTDTAPTA